jgi:hypothetical protein
MVGANLQVLDYLIELTRQTTASLFVATMMNYLEETAKTILCGTSTEVKQLYLLMKSQFRYKTITC